MKKIAMFMSAVALAFAFASCDQTSKDPIDLDNVTEDGFYVAGPATGAADIAAEYMMTAGVNEVLMDQEKKPWAESKRAGMYEKYIVLEGGKEFELLLYANGEKVRYSAVLADYDTKEIADNPTEAYGMLKRGSLVTGADAPAMKVEKTGLYHIVLDLNEGNDLPFGAQIVVAPVTMGVRGGMNGWGFTAFPEPAKYTNEGITWVLEDQNLAKGGTFKFAYNHAWKIQLDDAGKVKAHANLGEGAVNGATDIKVEKAGLYKITLTYKLASGDISASFKYDIVCTQESSLPTEMYIIGNEFGDWKWDAASVVTMNAVHSHPGAFWAIRYMTTATEFKFCAKKEWNGDFCTLGTNTGFVTPGNNKVEADGFYMIYVDLTNDFIVVEPAKVYGMGDVYGGWDKGVEANLFAADGQTLTSTAPAAGNIRMYAAAPAGSDADWWQMEFNVYDGKIVYRADGGDQAAVAVTAGQKVTLNFNAETGSIQ